MVPTPNDIDIMAITHIGAKSVTCSSSLAAEVSAPRLSFASRFTRLSDNYRLYIFNNPFNLFTVTVSFCDLFFIFFGQGCPGLIDRLLQARVKTGLFSL
jgi:hypothetical protein